MSTETSRETVEAYVRSKLRPDQQERWDDLSQEEVDRFITFLRSVGLLPGLEPAADVVYWAEWKDRQGVWHREDGWATQEAAEKSARFLRRDRHAAVRVVIRRR